MKPSEISSYITGAQVRFVREAATSTVYLDVYVKGS